MKKMPDKFNQLRKQAEALLSAPYDSATPHPMHELSKLLHELDTYRIELELQNDELLKVQTQLQDTTQDYIELYNFSPVGYITLNSEGIILKANMALAAMFGVELVHIVNKPFSDFVRDLDQDVLYFYRQELAANKSAPSCELRLRTNNGRDMWVLLDGLFKSGQERYEINLALTDITRLKKTQALLNKSEANLRTIFDNVLDGIIRIDEHGIIDSINPAVETIFAYSAEELLGLHISRIIPKIDWLAYYAQLAYCRDCGGCQTIGARQELEGLKKEGALFPIGLGISEINADQRFFILTIHDISERKQTEMALQQADRRKNEFLAMLGHELRNPLEPIRNAVRVLQNQSAANSTLDWCSQIIDRQVSHMALLLDDLLDIARITQNKITLKIECLDFADVLDGAIETCHPQIKARNQELLISRPNTPIWIKGDRVRLTQVLSNLLNNAAKFTAEGGKITLSVTEDTGFVLITLKDNGIGIPAEMLPHIFDLFTQADTSLAREHGGLGIGLTLARRLIEMHGGSISAASAGNLQGSEFTLRLPLTAAPSAVPTLQAPALTIPAKLRILIVDDYADIAESLALLLQLEGHEVETADSGLKAIEQARTFQPQAILLDIGLPDISGYEVAKRLRKLPQARQAFLIAMSGYGGAEHIEQAKSAGFDQHMLKPVNVSMLSSLLATAAARTHAVTASPDRCP